MTSFQYIRCSKTRNLLDHETSMDVMKPHETWPMWDLSATLQVWFGAFSQLQSPQLDSAAFGRSWKNVWQCNRKRCSNLWNRKSMVTLMSES